MKSFKFLCIYFNLLLFLSPFLNLALSISFSSVFLSYFIFLSYHIFVSMKFSILFHFFHLQLLQFLFPPLSSTNILTFSFIHFRPSSLSFFSFSLFPFFLIFFIFSLLPICANFCFFLTFSISSIYLSLSLSLSLFQFIYPKDDKWFCLILIISARSVLCKIIN